MEAIRLIGQTVEKILLENQENFLVPQRKCGIGIL